MCDVLHCDCSGKRQSPPWIANRSAANVNYGIKRARYAFHMLPAKLELKGPAVYTLRYR